ncbi:MAG: AAA family ATPase, partial [Defluviicoccus sp.]|nr:AAA family ATPase [Defluviicoccus sp.]
MTNFRNYESARVSVDRRPVVLTGANGAGKTNLLEALSFLVPGRGLRRAALERVARRGGPETWS